VTEQQGKGHESREPHQESAERGSGAYAGKTGQFDVVADGEKIAERGGNWLTRSFGAGYPDLESVVEKLENHRT
jgi:hypothetical protein